MNKTFPKGGEIKDYRKLTGELLPSVGIYIFFYTSKRVIY